MENILSLLSSLNPIHLTFFTLLTAVVFIVLELIFSMFTNLKFVNQFFLLTASKKWSGKIIGSLLVVALSFAANNWAVYVLGVVVIATLVTEMEFLLWVLTVLGNRVEVAKTMMGLQNQGDAPTPNDAKDILKLVRKLEEQGEKLVEAENQKMYHSLTEYFYDTYARIFGSQIEMLRMMASVPEKKVHRTLMENFFKSTPWVNQTTFPSYIAFLLSRLLIEHEEVTDMYKLTEVGETFLNFWENKGLNSINKLPF